MVRHFIFTRLLNDKEIEGHMIDILRMNSKDQKIFNRSKFNIERENLQILKS